MKNRSNAIDIQELKASVDLVALIESYGIELKKVGAQYECRCPFHDDETASLKVTPEKNLWNCFGCDAGGSAIDFIMRMENVGVAEAKAKLIERMPGVKRASALEQKAEAVPPASTPELESLVKDILAHAHRRLMRADSPGFAYLKNRYIDDPQMLKTLGVGFIDGSLRDLLPQDPAIIEQLKALGWLNDRGNPTFYNCVVVPVWQADGRLGEVFAHGVSDSRRLYLKGPHRGVFNGQAFKVFDEVIVCESIFDAMSLYAVGIQNVVATFGAKGWIVDHERLLADGKARKLVFAFDRDQAGKDGVAAIVKKLRQANLADELALHCLTLPDLAGVKDLNELLAHFWKDGLDASGIKATFESLIASAPRIGKVSTKSQKITLKERKGDEFTFVNGVIAYRLRGLLDNGNSSLRVVIRAECNHATKVASLDGTSRSHTDKLDLYTAKNRHSFAFHAAQRLGLPNVKIEDDLSKLIPQLEAIVHETRTPKAKEAKIPELTEAQKKATHSLLTAPDLLEKIARDLSGFGYVGETRNKQLAYLIATSRRLKKPLSAIVRSESGAGKSYLMECVAELMPSEDVFYFSRLTSQSLYYMGRDTLQHKLLIVDERNGSEDSEYPIRTLQTRRKLSLAVPIKNPKTGQIETQEVEILGPIAYMESTTSMKINPENENRSFEIYLDESPEQTARVFAAQKHAHAQGEEARAVKRKRIVERHRALQRSLSVVNIQIPFVDALEFPQMWTRGRRDIDRLLSLVEASAFLHQKQRKEVAPNVIEAAVEDYAIAYELSKNCLRHAWADLPRSAEALLDKIRAHVGKEAKKQALQTSEVLFKRRDIRAVTKLPDHIIKRGMRILEDLEYVQARRARNGGTNTYRLTSLPPAVNVLEGLTAPAQLKAKMEEKTQTGTL